MSKYKITINGRSYEIEVEPSDASSAKAAPAAAAPASAPAAKAPAPSAPAAVSAGSVVSPMPGTILKVNKAAGDKVEAGESVVVLEAMKMENDINSPVSGTIKSISVVKGQTVSKDQVLFEVG